jgi:DNA invertase Pin-like site-specific DNA recombinase
MLRLLSDVEKEKFEAVLCMDIDRLGRGAMSDQGIILETFKASDTKSSHREKYMTSTTRWMKPTQNLNPSWLGRS